MRWWQGGCCGVTIGFTECYAEGRSSCAMWTAQLCRVWYYPGLDPCLQREFLWGKHFGVFQNEVLFGRAGKLVVKKTCRRRAFSFTESVQILASTQFVASPKGHKSCISEPRPASVTCLCLLSCEILISSETLLWKEQPSKSTDPDLS